MGVLGGVVEIGEVLDVCREIVTVKAGEESDGISDVGAVQPDANSCGQAEGCWQAVSHGWYSERRSECDEKRHAGCPTLLSEGIVGDDGSQRMAYNHGWASAKFAYHQAVDFIRGVGVNEVNLD